MKKGDLLAQKDATDAKVRAWAAQKGHEDYAKALKKLDALIADDQKTWKRATSISASRSAARRCSAPRSRSCA